MKIAAVLIRDESAIDTKSQTAVQHNWIRPTVWGTAAVALAIAIYVFWNQSLIYPAAVEKQDWQRAGTTLDRLAFFGYDSYESRIRVGQGEATNGNLPGSVEHFRRATKMQPKSVSARTALATALQRMGAVDESIEEYLEALAIQPDFSDAHYNLGNALATRHRYQEAAVHFREVTRLRPDFSSGYTNLGNSLMRTGDREGAIEAYRQAVRMDPGATNARANLARVLQSQ